MLRRVAAAAALAVGAFCYGTTENLPVGLLGLIADGLDTSPSAVGLLVTGYGLAVAVVSVPLAKATAAIPRRRVLSVLLACFVVTNLVSAAADSYWLLLVARLGTALSQALFWPVAAVAAAGMFSPRVRGRAASVVFIGGTLAIMLGVPAGTWVGQQAGWRTSFLALSAVGLAALVTVAVLVPTSPPGQGHAATATDPDARRFRLLVLTTAFGIGGNFAFYTYVTEFLVDVSGFPEEAIGPLLALNGVLDCLGLLAATVLVDRSPRALLGGSAVVLTGSLLGLFAFGAAFPAVAAGCAALLGAGVAGMAVGIQARLMQIAPGSTDVASAWTSAAFNVGIGGGALVGGVVLPLTGARSTALAGAVLTAGAVAAVLRDGRLPRPAGPAHPAHPSGASGPIEPAGLPGSARGRGSGAGAREQVR